MKTGNNSLDTLDSLQVLDQKFYYFNLNRLSKQGWGDIQRLPYSLKVLLENILRFETGGEDARGDIEALVKRRRSPRALAGTGDSGCRRWRSAHTPWPAGAASRG